MDKMNILCLLGGPIIFPRSGPSADPPQRFSDHSQGIGSLYSHRTGSHSVPSSGQVTRIGVLEIAHPMANSGFTGRFREG